VNDHSRSEKPGAIMVTVVVMVAGWVEFLRDPIYAIGPSVRSITAAMS
jgi:hypothetical protein